MGALHYVRFDVLSDGSEFWMFYYKLHRHKGARRYVFVHEFLECYDHWMFYYTLYINMNDHHDECIDVI